MEILFLDAKGGNLDFLSRLPRLRTLSLVNWTPERTPLPQGLENLRSLLLPYGMSPVTQASLAGLSQLEQLTPTGIVEDFGALAKFTRLKTLNMLTGREKTTDVGQLKNLPLEYISFPPGISQEQFDVVVNDHPDLRAVELFDCENVKDLAALKRLKNLKALVLIKVIEEGDKFSADLKELKGLKLLVLPRWDGEEAEAKIADLQKALPDCLISPSLPLKTLQ